MIERFDDSLAAYKQSPYNETQARREFVDPLFKLLGWDIDNEQEYAEAYKDVVHEDAIIVDAIVQRTVGKLPSRFRTSRPCSSARSRRRIVRSTCWSMSCMG